MTINITKYNKSPDGDLNVPVSVAERETEEWSILRDNGSGTTGFDTEEDARLWWEEHGVTSNSAYLVCTKVSVKQHGRL